MSFAFTTFSTVETTPGAVPSTVPQPEIAAAEAERAREMIAKIVPNVRVSRGGFEQHRSLDSIRWTHLLSQAAVR